MSEINVDLVTEYFNYDSESGFLTWKKSPAYNVKVGDFAGSLNKKTGYYYVSLKDKQYLVHRVAYVIHHKKDICDNGIIDHKNHNTIDNRISNLRLVTKRFNSGHRKKKSSSRYVGVHLHSGKWESNIQINGKIKYIGRFLYEIDAHIAYQIELGKLVGGNEEFLLAKKYRNGELADEDAEIINNCFEAHCFERGQLSIKHWIHYKAFEVLFHNTDLSGGDLKRLRENKKGTRIKDEKREDNQ